MILKYFSYTVAIVLCLASSVCGISDTVNTTIGVLKGKMATFEGRDIYQFRMVPYAEPPTAERRFQPPVAKARQNTQIDVSKDEFVVCPQPVGTTELETVASGLLRDNGTQNENCLFLDIYVPASASSTNQMAVMFWVHGGAYTAGAGRLTSGLVIASQYDVIVVTINYRLGVLGFLHLGGPAMADNGLRDQVLALQWVNDNIAGFGGDKSKITLAGESAGAASVLQLSILPETRGLFQRVIGQSGGFNNPWACSHMLPSQSTDFAARINCTQKKQEEIFKCLRSKSADEILNIQGGLTWSPACSSGIIPLTFEEMKSNPNNSITQNLANIDMLLGVNGQEGLIVHKTFVELLFSNDTVFDYEVPYMQILLQIKMLSAEQMQAVLPACRFQYTDWAMPNDNISKIRSIIDMTGDMYFNPYAFEAKKLHKNIVESSSAANKGSSYFYIFEHRPSFMSRGPYITAADHGDDLFFTFGQTLQFPSLNATDAEKQLSKNILTYWTNFIKTGNPNTPETMVDGNSLVQWPEYELNGEKVLGLDTTISVQQRVFSRRMAFWTQYIPYEIKRLSSVTTPGPCMSPVKDTSSCSKCQAIVFVSLISGIMFFYLYN